MALVTEVNVNELAELLERGGSYYSDIPLELRAGGTSNWYFDGRAAISYAPVAESVVQLGQDVLDAAEVKKCEVVAGLGIAGSALATFMALVCKYELAAGNDNDSSGQRYGYGMHGARVKDREVLIFDDTASTGDSLITLTDLVIKAGGIVRTGIAMADRSRGEVAKRMFDERGVQLFTLFDFNIMTGKLTPGANVS